MSDWLQQPHSSSVLFTAPSITHSYQAQFLGDQIYTTFVENIGQGVSCLNDRCLRVRNRTAWFTDLRNCNFACDTVKSKIPFERLRSQMQIISHRRSNLSVTDTPQWSCCFVNSHVCDFGYEDVLVYSCSNKKVMGTVWSRDSKLYYLLTLWSNTTML